MVNHMLVLLEPGLVDAGTKRLIQIHSSNWGAVTETITALTINALVKTGLLDWNAPVTQYLPELKKSPPKTAGQVLADRLAFAGFSDQRREHDLQNLSYWDYQTVKDLALNKCHRLPPTEAGLGLHAMPILDRARLLKTVKYFSKDDLPMMGSERRHSEPTAFSYALLGLIIEKVAKENHVNSETPWYRGLGEIMLDANMHTTTARTTEVENHGNYTVSRRMVSGRGPDIEKFVETSRWKTSERDVFGPATGLYSSLEDLLNLCCWVLDTLEQRPADIRLMFDPGEKDLQNPQRLGWSLASNAITPLVKITEPESNAADKRSPNSEELDVCFYRSRSTGVDHNARITLCPQFQIGVVVLSNTSSGIDFTAYADQLMLQTISSLIPKANVRSLMLQEKVHRRLSYRKEFLAPYLRTRDLTTFFGGVHPLNRQSLASIVTQMVGTYANVELERFITLGAHPAQMVAKEDSDLKKRPGNAAKDPVVWVKKDPRLEPLARICQLAMTFDEDYPHQSICLVPHHADLTTEVGVRTEWWGFLPLTEKDFYRDGCGHLKGADQTLVRVEKNAVMEVTAIIVDVGGRAVKFEKVKGEKEVQRRRDHVFLNRKLCRQSETAFQI